MATDPHINFSALLENAPELPILQPGFSEAGLRLLVKRARIHIIYFWRHRRRLNLSKPKRFTELVQARKLHPRNVVISRLIDKIKVKHFVAAQIGRDWVIPTLWHGTRLPDHPISASPVIVKSSHGCNQYVVFHPETGDWADIKRKAAKWIRRPYGRWLDEGYYADVEPAVLIEPFMSPNGDLPVDYKLYVFGGKVAFVQVHVGRGAHHRWALFDRGWQRISKETCSGIGPPISLTDMIEAAEILAANIDFVRIDFYEIAGKPLFGEMTFYPGSGLDPFYPECIDAIMGDLWLEAQLKAQII